MSDTDYSAEEHVFIIKQKLYQELVATKDLVNTKNEQIDVLVSRINSLEEQALANKYKMELLESIYTGLLDKAYRDKYGT